MLDDIANTTRHANELAKAMPKLKLLEFARLFHAVIHLLMHSSRVLTDNQFPSVHSFIHKSRNTLDVRAVQSAFGSMALYFLNLFSWEWSTKLEEPWKHGGWSGQHFPALPPEKHFFNGLKRTRGVLQSISLQGGHLSEVDSQSWSAFLYSWFRRAGLENCCIPWELDTNLSPKPPLI